MLPVMPGLSVLSNYVRAVRYPDGAVINGTGSAEPGYVASAAIAPGDVIALYGTGFGPVQGNAPVGTVFSGAYQTTNNVTVRVGDVDAEVLWAGLVGPGLYQLNVRVPGTIADGDYQVTASVAGSSSQSSKALLKVSASAKVASLRIRPRDARNFFPTRGFSIDRYAALVTLSPTLEHSPGLVRLA